MRTATTLRSCLWLLGEVLATAPKSPGLKLPDEKLPDRQSRPQNASPAYPFPRHLQLKGMTYGPLKTRLSRLMFRSRKHGWCVRSGEPNTLLM